MADRTFNAEDWRLADSIIRHDINRDFVIRLILVCNKYSWICPVDQCHHMYGNKQRLDRHLGKVHPNEPDNSSIDKSNGNHIEKLVTILDKEVERHPRAIPGGDDGNQMHAPVNAPQLSGLSPQGDSPGHYDIHQTTQSPSSLDGGGAAVPSLLDQETGPRLYLASSGNFTPGADAGYGVPGDSQTPRNQPSWMTSGTEPGPLVPYGQSSCSNSDPSGPWSNNLASAQAQQDYAIDAMIPDSNPAGFSTQLTALSFPVPIHTNQEYHHSYGGQQQHQYQQQNLDHVPTQHQGRHWRQ